MADSFASLLIHTAAIERPKTTVGARKQTTESYEPVAAAVRCRIKPVKADSKQAIGGAIFDSDHKAYFLPGVELAEGYLVVQDGTGARFEVRGVERPVDGTGVHHLTAHLKRKQIG